MGSLYQHKERGSVYELIAIGKMQSDGWMEVIPKMVAVDMRDVAIYRSVSDPTEILVRPREEFEDGRFEALPTELIGTTDPITAALKGGRP